MGSLSKIAAFFMVIINALCSLFNVPQYPYSETVDMSKFKETSVFADEFNGTELDTSVWRIHGGVPAVRRGGYWDTSLAVVHDGNLHIKSAYYENGIGKNGAGWYTAGIDTKESFNATYGYYECRCILPEGYGLWSAFWLYSDSVCDVNGNGEDGTEIDIFESAYWGERGNKKYSVQPALHYDGYGEAHESESYGKWRVGEDMYNAYHTYGLEWNEDGYTFYIDGKKTAHSDFGSVSKVPEFIILSVEFGGENGIPAESWVKGVISENEGGTDFTADFIVDYVRVYEYKQ